MARRACRVAVPLAAALASLGIAACLGPYAQVGQKLDVAETFASGETWISYVGTEIHLLVLGRDRGGAPIGFALSSFDVSETAGVSGRMLRGTWSEASGTLRLAERLEYTMPDERDKGLLNRAGSQRNDVDRSLVLSAARTPTTLALGGDAAWAATYALLPAALANLGTATADDAACAFHLANLAVMTSQVRIIGFGGPGMLQYHNPQDFVGTLSGFVHVKTGVPSPTDITFDGYSDFSGVELDGLQHTNAGLSGDGDMAGTVDFTFRPDGAPPIHGTILYGDGGPDSLQIKNGIAVSGHYLVTFDDGVSAKVSPVGPPTPNIAKCLGLP
jgi:hypothetical protein